MGWEELFSKEQDRLFHVLNMFNLSLEELIDELKAEGVDNRILSGARNAHYPTELRIAVQKTGQRYRHALSLQILKTLSANIGPVTIREHIWTLMESIDDVFPVGSGERSKFMGSVQIGDEEDSIPQFDDEAIEQQMRRYKAEYDTQVQELRNYLVQVLAKRSGALEDADYDSILTGNLIAAFNRIKSEYSKEAILNNLGQYGIEDDMDAEREKFFFFIKEEFKGYQASGDEVYNFLKKLMGDND